MKNEKLASYVKENNGYYRISDARMLGVSKSEAVQFVKNAGLSRVAPGVYCSEEAWPDRLYLIQLRNRKIVFSHETALYLHGLSDRESKQPIVTVKRGYNASHLKKDNIEVHTVVEDWFEIGTTTAETSFGNIVRVYDKERCICDILREKKRMDIQVFQTAMNAYFKSRDKDIHKLMEYAAVFGLRIKCGNIRRFCYDKNRYPGESADPEQIGR